MQTEGPKKIEDIHRDAAMERNRAQAMERQQPRGGGRDMPRGPPSYATWVHAGELLRCVKTR